MEDGKSVSVRVGCLELSPCANDIVHGEVQFGLAVGNSAQMSDIQNIGDRGWKNGGGTEKKSGGGPLVVATDDDRLLSAHWRWIGVWHCAAFGHGESMGGNDP